jgi:hypothetical protein
MRSESLRRKAERAEWVYDTNHFFGVLTEDEIKDGGILFSEREIIKRIQQKYKDVECPKRITDPYHIVKTFKGLTRLELLEYHGLRVPTSSPDGYVTPCYSVTDQAREILLNPVLSEWLLSLPRNRFLYRLDFIRRQLFETKIPFLSRLRS